jgi:hypothetical protein
MKERSSPATQYAEYETSSAFFFGEPSGLSSYFLIGSFVLCFKIEEDFYESFSRFEKFSRCNHPKVVPENAKRPPGNRVASSLGRIVPTEAKPSELSGEILSLAKYRVKAKTCRL